MDILSEPVEEKPSLGGMYGSSGFFFQQRRGHLNLRSLAAINIDKLVREVDVDTLQVHIENITFCNLREEDLRYLTDPQIVKLFRVSQLTLEYLLYSQDKLVDNLNQLARKYTDKKRGLSKKRRELVQLEESTKLLHSQVRAKKQNIATLQDLLKEANRTREQELRLRLKGQKGQKGHEEEEEEKPSVKFFIQGPEGVCVEFAEKPERTVAHLLREARKAFVSRRDSEELPDLRLIHRGRMLLAEQTIGDCEIRSGDMLVAMLLEPKKPEPAPAPAPVQLPVAPVAPAPVDHEALTKHMLEIFSKQQSESMRELAADINSGWKTALETISASANRPEVAPSDPQILADMNSNWSRTELGLRQQIDSLVNKHATTAEELHHLSVLATRRRFQLGELESDDEARTNIVDLGPLSGRIDGLAATTSTDICGLRALIMAQTAEMAELRRLLAERKEAPQEVTIVQAPQASPQATEAPERLPPKEMKQVEVAQVEQAPRSKWDMAHAADSVEEPVRGSREVSFLEVPKKPERVQPEPVVPVPELQVGPEVSEVPEVPEPVVLKPTVVDLVFPRIFNQELSVLLFTAQEFRVQVLSDIALDDLLFEVRKSASTKTRTQFAKVTMEYRGARVVLGMDLGDAIMTAKEAAICASTGDLRIRIQPGNPLTNAQIDMLVPAWEKTKGEKTKVFAGKKAEAGGSEKRAPLKRRDWGDDAKDEAEEDGQAGALPKKVYTKVRGSLDEALSELSAREGLTDDELQEHMGRLRQLTEANLPQHMTDQLKSFRGSMAGALVAAAHDSGSDTGNASEDYGAGRLGAADVRQSGSLSHSVSHSISLRAKGGGFLRSPVSSPGSVSRSNSVGRGGGVEHSNSSVSSGSRARRSVEQFEQEGGLGDDSDDAPMLASINSAEFRRTTDPMLAGARDPRGYGIAHSGVPASAGADSLLYSPSVSNTRSRYSVEDGSDEEGGQGDRGIGVAGGQGDKSWRGRPTPMDQSPLRAGAKPTRGGGGEGGGRKGDSVDSAKLEYQSRVTRGSKPDLDRESADRREGDRTLISSIPTVDSAGDSVNSFTSEHGSEFRGQAGRPLGTTANTEELSTVLSTTIDSEGDIVRTGTQGIRGSEVGRRADAYERDAKSNVEDFHDDEGSINSLALSDSNNIDDL